MVTLSTYFAKKMSLASGIMYAGGSCGQLAMPHILAYLLEEYTLRHTFIIWGACLLQIWWPACLFRPPSYYSQKEVSTPVKETEKQPDKNFSEKPEKNDTTEKYKKFSEQQANYDNASSTNQKFHREENTEHLIISHIEINGITNDILDPQTVSNTQNSLISDFPAKLSEVTEIKPNNKETRIHSNAPNGDSIPTVSLSVQAKEGSSIITESQNLSARKEPSTFCSRLRGSLNELCQNSPFIAFVPGFSFAMNGYLSCYIFVPGYGEDHGLSHEQVATVLSVAGATDIAMRIGIGWFSSLGLVPSSLIMACSSLLGGAIIFPCVYFPSYGSTIALMLLVAMFGAPLQVLQPTVTREFVGDDAFPDALAFIQFYYGMFAGTWIPPALGNVLTTTPDNINIIS